MASGTIRRQPQLPTRCKAMAGLCAIGWIALIGIPNNWHVPRAGFPGVFDYYAGLYEVEVKQGGYGWLVKQGAKVARRAGVKDDYIKLVESNVMPAGRYTILEAVERNCAKGIMQLIPGSVEFCNEWTRLKYASIGMLCAASFTAALLFVAMCSCSWWSGKWCLTLAPCSASVALCAYGLSTYRFPGTKGLDFPYTFGPCFWAACAHAVFTFVPAVVAMYYVPPDDLVYVDDFQNEGFPDKEVQSWQASSGSPPVLPFHSNVHPVSAGTPLIASQRQSQILPGFQRPSQLLSVSQPPSQVYSGQAGTSAVGNLYGSVTPPQVNSGQSGSPDVSDAYGSVAPPPHSRPAMEPVIPDTDTSYGTIAPPPHS